MAEDESSSTDEAIKYLSLLINKTNVEFMDKNITIQLIVHSVDMFDKFAILQRGMSGN